ncbi:hypothetical protein BKA70DRAFT_1253589, partial [Coprinopsis sp. MPI-PUGE-AT-0042]
CPCPLQPTWKAATAPCALLNLLAMPVAWRFPLQLPIEHPGHAEVVACDFCFPCTSWPRRICSETCSNQGERFQSLWASLLRTDVFWNSMSHFWHTRYAGIYTFRMAIVQRSLLGHFLIRLGKS